MTERNLYGAITTTFDLRFRDASYTRRVPNNQEVFVDSNRDESLVFEVNELKENVLDENGATHFLDELKNKLYPEAKMDHIHEPKIKCELKESIPEVFVTTAVGKVEVPKRRQGGDVQNFVKIYLANIRLKDKRYKTDVTITAYQPVSTASRSSPTGNQIDPSKDMADILKDIIYNFKVTDWTFFEEGS